jgi:membrane associated rhomboid family serine protease
LRSQPASQLPQKQPPEAPREPILTLPGALIVYIALLAVIHLVRMMLPFDIDDLVIEMFGFIPKRYDSTLLDVTFPGGEGAKVWTFVTYSLLHANLGHIGFNVLWLLPFGSALARRFSATRFFLFMAVTAATGALAHFITHEHAVAPMIGASASVSGVAQRPRARVPRDMVRRQYHLWHGLDRNRCRRRQRRLAGAYRRLSRRADAVLAVRSRSAREHPCCGRDAARLKIACGPRRIHSSSHLTRQGYRARKRA